MPKNRGGGEQWQPISDREKAYKRIGFEDRKKIEALNAQGKTVDEMAMAIGVHSATMYRELARGGEPYKAEVAQHSI